jgi:hypothetical protein
MMEAIKVVKRRFSKKSSGFFEDNYLTKTVPTAPIPVHTAYAVL